MPKNWRFVRKYSKEKIVKFPKYWTISEGGKKMVKKIDLANFDICYKGSCPDHKYAKYIEIGQVVSKLWPSFTFFRPKLIGFLTFDN
jgi:hypothetical protein